MIYQIATIIVGVLISLIFWSENYKALGEHEPSTKFTIFSCIFTSLAIIIPLATIGIVFAWFIDMYTDKTEARPTVPTMADIKELDIRIYPLWVVTALSTIVTIFIF